MLIGWLSDSDGNKYYMDMSNGKMSTGWKQIDGSWYYFNSNGHMMTGWIQLENESDDPEMTHSWYYFDTNGKW